MYTIPLISCLFLLLLVKVVHTMSIDVKALIAEVAANTSVIQSAETLLTSLSAEIAAISAANNDPALQTQIDALTTALTTGTTSLAAAVAANTPAAPAPSAS